jgi:hypothetical protein
MGRGNHIIVKMYDFNSVWYIFYKDLVIHDLQWQLLNSRRREHERSFREQGWGSGGLSIVVYLL